MPTVQTTDAVRECVHCGKRLKNPKARYCSPACFSRSVERRQRLREWRAKRIAAGLPTVPTPTEIESECLAIQAGWSEQERIDRMRVDKRPTPWEVQMVPGSAFPVKEL